MSKSIYPSIPAPGNTPESQQATLNAMRQALTMVIMNAQEPSPNFTPSSAAQVFVTSAQLAKANTAASTTASTVTSQGSSIQTMQGQITTLQSQIATMQQSLATLTNQFDNLNHSFPQVSFQGQYGDLGVNANISSWAAQGIGLTGNTNNTTQFLVCASGTINNDTQHQYTEIVLCYGIGAPPAFGTTITGDLICQPVVFFGLDPLSYYNEGPFAMSAILKGLPNNVQFWVDIAAAVSGGNGSVTGATVFIQELQ